MRPGDAVQRLSGATDAGDTAAALVHVPSVGGGVRGDMRWPGVSGMHVGTRTAPLRLVESMIANESIRVGSQSRPF